MNILMCTNTYTPHVGGVAHSVATFAREIRRKGHRVGIICPEFPDFEEETDVFRVPAVQNFNGSDFSVQVPIPFFLTPILDSFQPDVVHSHHPFLLGDTAQRIAAARNVPLVFTHHTLYEHYTHYVPNDSELLQRFAIELATTYANLCDYVIAPSQSIALLLQERGVTTDIVDIPTGIDVLRYQSGTGASIRAHYSIPDDALVIGHVGRLAPEKNLAFLARAVSRCLLDLQNAVFLVVGEGPSQERISRIFEELGVADRLILAGRKTDQDLINCYDAMDVFAFASRSETQGMVLAEAMAASLPVVALDASGVREIVNPSLNGTLLYRESEEDFAAALARMLTVEPEERSRLQSEARKTADKLSAEHCADRTIEVYTSLTGACPKTALDLDPWSAAMRFFEREWELVSGKAQALTSALSSQDTPTSTVRR